MHEVAPVRDITAEIVAKAFYDNWIARFGCPLRLSTDQGRQFESALFNALMKKFGITRIRCTAFHPIANGQIERFHRTLKAALMARGVTSQWSEGLPTVLLGLRTALRGEQNISPALMTYGATLRIPSDFFVPEQSNIEDSSFVRLLSETMASLSPTPVARHHNKERPFVYKDLATCTHVFVRNDTVRRPLTPPYDGSYEVLERYDKYFKIQTPRRTTMVSLDRLKPAYILIEEAETPRAVTNTSTSPIGTASLKTPAPSTAAATNIQNTPYITRSGRKVKKTVRFA